MLGKRIVILGGGFGGAAAARILRKLLDARHTVTGSAGPTCVAPCPG